MEFAINSQEAFLENYRTSVEEPEKFWEEIACHYDWIKRWDDLLEFDMKDARFAWFKNGKLNITANAIDRHLETLGTKTAILFEPNDPNEVAQHITYDP